MFFKKAVLLIHGFSGSTYDMELLRNQLEKKRNYSVFAWTLPGHEKFFLREVGSLDWKRAVEDQIQYILDAGYRQIYVIGHSMGGMLALSLLKHKEVKKVVLLSAAYLYPSTRQNFNDVIHWDIMKDPDAGYRRFFLKLIKVSKRTRGEFKKCVTSLRKCVRQVDIPCLVLHGTLDEVIPVSAAYQIYQNMPTKEKTLTYVEGGRHVLLRGKKRQEINDYIELFLKGGRKWKQKKTFKL